MVNIFGSQWTRRHGWKVVVLSISGWAAFYVAFVVPMEMSRSNKIAAQKSGGLGAVAGDWDSLLIWRTAPTRDEWRQHRFASERGSVKQYVAMEVYSGKASAVNAAEMMAVEEPSGGRKIIRNGALDLEVANPAESVEKIRAIAENLGGYVEASGVRSDDGTPGGGITLRVPTARFDEAVHAIRKLATRVEAENADAKDVTRDYVDQEARLRNLRAEEERYLAIMQNAKTVKDTLEVSEKLGEVRGEIERQQAEFITLSKQIETVAITISLRAEADTRVFGMHWRPIYGIKLAARNGLESVGNYMSAITAFAFRLPAILLWMVTMIFVCVVTLRIWRWVWRRFFIPPVTARVVEEADGSAV